MNANFKISVYSTAKIRAEFEARENHQWINFYFTGEDSVEVAAMTMFFEDRVTARAYANAINSVNSKPVVAIDEQVAA